MNRRRFLQKTLLGTAAIAIGANSAKRAFSSPYNMPVGIELYTVRREMVKDAPGTLAAIGKIGFREVEIIDFRGAVDNNPSKILGLSGREFKRMLNDSGLRAPSGHYSTDDIKHNWDQSIELASEIGLETMTNAWGKDEDTMTMDSWKRLVDLLNKAAEPVHKAGMTYNYHNHNFEFVTIGNTMIYDYLTENLDPRMKFTLDCYWATHAGQDPVKLMEARPGRVSILHVKDMPKGLAPALDYDGEVSHFTEAGSGAIDWKRIFKAAPIGGVKHFYCEQDFCKLPPLESAKISFEYLDKLTV